MGATIITIAIPFFSDLASICGAIGVAPLTFVLPLMLWNTKHGGGGGIHHKNGTKNNDNTIKNDGGGGGGEDYSATTTTNKYRIALHRIIMILFVIISIFALIGSIQNVFMLKNQEISNAR